MACYQCNAISTKAKLFADNTSLFPVIHVSQTFANDHSKDLEAIYNWTFQLKMNFKQAQEVIFSRKTKKKLPHPPLMFNNVNVA